MKRCEYTEGPQATKNFEHLARTGLSVQLTGGPDRVKPLTNAFVCS